jgi:hypothetical protein
VPVVATGRVGLVISGSGNSSGGQPACRPENSQ